MTRDHVWFIKYVGYYNLIANGLHTMGITHNAYVQLQNNKVGAMLVISGMKKHCYLIYHSFLLLYQH